MVRYFFGFVCLVAALVLFAACSPQDAAQDGKVRLVMSSWRVEDKPFMGAIFEAFQKEHPGIELAFEPVVNSSYDNATLLALASGKGADVFLVSSYGRGRPLQDAGFLLDLSAEPLVKQRFDEHVTAPWTTEDGVLYALPIMFVSHGIFYNKEIFAAEGIDVPETWEDFLAACAKLRKNGILPISNGLASGWDPVEVILFSILPNFIGGMEGRLSYERRERKFNDPQMLAAFQAIKDLRPYLPDDRAMLGYDQAMARFAEGKAAMFFNGSWGISAVSAAKPDFEWGVFAPPPPAGKAPAMCFHADAAIGVNPAGAHVKESLLFVRWLSSSKGAEALSTISGFYPPTKEPYSIRDEHATDLLALNAGRLLDSRFTWPRFQSGRPSGYDLMQYGVIGILNGMLEPQEVVDRLEEGMVRWYKP